MKQMHIHRIARANNKKVNTIMMNDTKREREEEGEKKYCKTIERKKERNKVENVHSNCTLLLVYF